MNPEEMSQHWQQQSQDVAKRLAEWRNAHPKATLAEIEIAVDEQMHQARARLIEEVAQSSPSQHALDQKKKTLCPQCGTPMQSRGKRQRSLQTQGGQSLTLTRQYHSCPSCGYSFFPPR
jgi:ribosomal protein S27AE